MRLTALARQVLYGDGRGLGRLTADRWLRSAAGGRQIAGRCARIAIGWLLREGGAWPQTIWDAEGRPLATGPLWEPAIRAAGEWRLSTASGDLLLWAAASEADEAPPADFGWAPKTPLDLVLGEALLALAERRGAARRLRWPELLRARSPLGAIWRCEAGEDERRFDGLAPYLSADWLLPFLEARTIRRWLALESRRRLLSAAGHRSLNLAQARAHEVLWSGWEARGRAEHASLWARYYPRWLAQQGGAAGVLQQVRSTLDGDRSVREREAYELSFGRLLEPAMRLVGRAAELRGYGWQLTPAEERFLGLYSREFEPHVDELRTLYDALCRMI